MVQDIYGQKKLWLNQTGYLQGVFWIVLVSLISSSNDVLMRLTGSRLPAMEITFFRSFFAFLTLLPLVLIQGRAALITTRPKLHCLRGILGFGAIAFWCAGVNIVPLAVVSTLAFTVPIFVLPMAIVFLGEKVSWQRTTATLFGFCGIAIIVNGMGNTPSDGSQTQSVISSILTLEKGTLFLISATILFALSDILNKKMVVKESNLTMLFYFAVGTALCGFVPAYMVWEIPTFLELCYLFLLGTGGNLILYCLLKAFAATDVSALAPYRYVELFFACFYGLVLFGEVPSSATLIGAAVIIPSTFAIAYYETRQQRQKIRAVTQENKINNES
ncbi:MAG: DMT family transporter [Janthinobacterium lividum]